MALLVPGSFVLGEDILEIPLFGSRLAIAGFDVVLLVDFVCHVHLVGRWESLANEGSDCEKRCEAPVSKSVSEG